MQQFKISNDIKPVTLIRITSSTVTFMCNISIMESLTTSICVVPWLVCLRLLFKFTVKHKPTQFQAIITGDLLSAWEHGKERPTLYFEDEQLDQVVSFLFLVIRETPRARQLTDWVALIFDVLLPEVWHDCFVYIHLLILALCFILYILVFHITPHTW